MHANTPGKMFPWTAEQWSAGVERLRQHLRQQLIAVGEASDTKPPYADLPQVAKAIRRDLRTAGLPVRRILVHVGRGAGTSSIRISLPADCPEGLVDIIERMLSSVYVIGCFDGQTDSYTFYRAPRTGWFLDPKDHTRILRSHLRFLFTSRSV